MAVWIYFSLIGEDWGPHGKTTCRPLGFSSQSQGREDPSCQNSNICPIFRPGVCHCSSFYLHKLSSLTGGRWEPAVFFLNMAKCISPQWLNVFLTTWFWYFCCRLYRLYQHNLSSLTGLRWQPAKTWRCFPFVCHTTHPPSTWSQCFAPHTLPLIITMHNATKKPKYHAAHIGCDCGGRIGNIGNFWGCFQFWPVPITWSRDKRKVTKVHQVHKV